MRYLLDTNLLAKRDLEAKTRNWIVQHTGQIALSAITLAEVSHGLERLPTGKRRTQITAFLSEIQEDYPIIPFGKAEALAWGLYVAQVGRPVPVLDSLIAATAIANDLQLVTENAGDFPGIEIINPIKD
jgi:predicted nucleic acid-binding protein